MVMFNKTSLNADDLKQMGIWNIKEDLREELLNREKRNNCLIIQGGAFVVDNYAFLILGMGTIDILETLSQFNDIEGIIGTGNALFISRDFRFVYSPLSKEDTLKRYEINKTKHFFKYKYTAKLAPLIILNRAFKDKREFYNIKNKKINEITFDLGNSFFIKSIKYSGTLKSRLRAKFIRTTTTVHCATHPTLAKKELVFDDVDKIKELINNFKGYFLLGYMLWNEKFANSVGMASNYNLDLETNPSQILGFTLLKLAQQFYKNNKNKIKKSLF